MNSPAPKVVAMIQARMGSTRLPGKVLTPIEGKPVLWHVVQRVKAAKLVNEVAVLTSEREENGPIRELCAREGIACFSGNEQDVLERFYRAAKQFSADCIVRVTADCPLIDGALVDRILTEITKGNLDYCAVGTGAGVANEKQFRRFPDGMDAEAFTFQTLERTWKGATLPQHREHVTPYIFLHQSTFRVRYLESDTDLSHLRLTLDYPEDLMLIRKVFAELGKNNAAFSLGEILRYLEKNPSLLELNKAKAETTNYKEFYKA